MIVVLEEDDGGVTMIAGPSNDDLAVSYASKPKEHRLARAMDPSAALSEKMYADVPEQLPAPLPKAEHEQLTEALRRARAAEETRAWFRRMRNVNQEGLPT